MRFVVALLAGAILCCAGCNDSSVKEEFMTMDQLKDSRKFLGYDVVLGPGLVEPYERKAKEDARTCNTEKVDMKGPFMLSGEVNVDIPIETQDPFHRRVLVDDQYYEFKLEGNVIGFGFRLLSVRNKQNELGIFILKTKGVVQDLSQPSGPEAGRRPRGGGDDKSKRRQGRQGRR